MSQAFTDVRPSPIAGQWYPGNAGQLGRTIDRMLEEAPDAEIPGRIVGLMVPHAGVRYSGPFAAHAFKLLKGLTFERVVILSPMHQIYSEPILTSAHDAYETPLGAVPVDQDALHAITKRVRIAPIRHDPEHSLEIELPFLQRALADTFRLVPIMFRDQTYEAARRVGEAVADVVRDDGSTLLVASSDLSHFYTDAQARRLDRVMLDQVEAFDPQGVMRAEEEGKAFACGRTAIAAMLVAARALGADHAQIVGYGTSGDTSGDRSRVVGYGAAVVYQRT